MSKLAMQLQQQINDTLRKADSDIRVYVSCLEKAKAEVSVDKKRESLEKLRALNTTLQQHKDQVRQLTTQAGARHVKTNKLAEARQRIEHELQRFQEFETATGCSTPDASAETNSNSSTDGQDDAEEKVTVAQLLNEDGVTTEIQEEFTCKICLVHVVGCTPMLTSCSHLFCGDCLAQWFKAQPGIKTWAQRAQAAGSVPCPVCKEPLRKEKDLHPVCKNGDGGSKMLYRMLCDTKIICANNPKCSASGKCNWVGDYGSYQDHIRLCQNLPIPDSSAPPAEDMVCDAECESWDCKGELPEHPASVECGEAPSVHSSKDEDEAVEPEVVDTSLSGLIGALVSLELQQTKDDSRPRIESDDTCSTCAEVEASASEAGSSEHVPSPVASDMGKRVLDEDFGSDASQSRAPQASKKPESKKDVPPGNMWAQQSAMAAQWQMAQLRAAQYQAAQYQAAQYQAAQYAQMAQWQHAQQAAYAAHVSQLQAKQALQWQKARAANA